MRGTGLVQVGLAIGLMIALVPGGAQALAPASVTVSSQGSNDATVASEPCVNVGNLLPGIATASEVCTSDFFDPGNNCNGAVDADCTCGNDQISECKKGQDCTLYTDIDIDSDIDGWCHVG